MNWIVTIGILVFSTVFMIWRLERLITAQVAVPVVASPGARRSHRIGRQ